MKQGNSVAIPIGKSLFRGERRLHIALVGARGGGKTALFRAVQATSVRRAAMSGAHRAYDECIVQIGLDEARVVDLPGLRSMRDTDEDNRATLRYLLWGDRPTLVARHEGEAAPFARPDVIVQVIDATALERHLELTIELLTLSRPLVIALNRMDEARAQGLYISSKALSRRLGVPVIPTSAARGYGVAQVFRTAVEAVRKGHASTPLALSEHLRVALAPIESALEDREIQAAFGVAPRFLLMQLSQGDSYFLDELRQHFPAAAHDLEQLRATASASLPRPLREELHAERHHRAASLAEAATRPDRADDARDLRYWLDEMFLSPHWSIVGTAAVFAAALFMVLFASAWLDSLTTARLAEWASDWQPVSTAGVVGRAVIDGVIGLVGIVVPYMLPLMLMLVALEHSGVMARIGFVVDRVFHRIGLHGAVALPFLMGLGCNVPAIASLAHSTRGRERVIASLLITFVPCSARSAIVLAIAGKYLGTLGVLATFACVLLVIAVLGKLLQRYAPEPEPGLVPEIPPYALPKIKPLLRETWARTQDIVTIVLPLLVAGSVVLALLSHYGADAVINAALQPLTQLWLGLPVALGVPILFGVLRKELSLLMLYQALGSFDLHQFLDATQLFTLLLFLTFYVPCLSTFAVMLKSVGRATAIQSVLLSIGVAFAISGLVRFAMLGFQLLTA